MPQNDNAPPNQEFPNWGYPKTEYPNRAAWRGLNIVRNVDKLLMTQKRRFFELCCGGTCYGGKTYNFNHVDENGRKKGRKILKAQDDPICCCWTACCYCKDTPGEIIHQQGPFDEQQIFSTNVPYKCCTCGIFGLCNRPEMRVSYTEAGDEIELGYAKDPCRCCGCCNIRIDTYNAEDEKIFEVDATKCQCGYCFPCMPCEPCQTMEFEIQRDDEKFGHVIRNSPGIRSYDQSFNIDFPDNATPYEKALLLTSTIFVSKRLFEFF
mmetsp:Transcript_32297/g.29124  ORF Transcript_32297/g.29124 Transcript_32297/m.29124 type:complete len:265 (-) Transcript_32297:118-912(-)